MKLQHMVQRHQRRHRQLVAANAKLPTQVMIERGVKHRARFHILAFGGDSVNHHTVEGRHNRQEFVVLLTLGQVGNLLLIQTQQEQSLFVGPLTELDVAPDGSAVAFCTGRGHMAMGLAVLKLDPPSEAGGLPRAIGEPEFVVRTVGTWHVHNGGWSADSKSLAYTQDKDYGDIYELVKRQ